MGIFFCDRCQQIPDENDRCACDRADEDEDDNQLDEHAVARLEPEGAAMLRRVEPVLRLGT